MTTPAWRTRAAGVVALTMLLLAAGAEPVQAQAGRRSCSVDVVDQAAGAVYRDCDVDQPARLRRDARPGYVFPSGRRCVFAELVFVVDSTGLPDTTTAAVIETDAPDYARLLLQSLRDWRYRPAQLRGVAVRQVVRERRALSDGRVPFTVPGSATPPAPPTPCR